MFFQHPDQIEKHQVFILVFPVCTSILDGYRISQFIVRQHIAIAVINIASGSRGIDRLQGFGHILGQILFAVYDLHIEQFADQSKKHQGKDDCQGKYPGTCDFFYCFLQNF